MHRFIGRTLEIELIDQHVSTGGALAVTGPSGVGKTAVVQAWASRRDAAWANCSGLSFSEVARVFCPEEFEGPIDARDAWLLASEVIASKDVLVLDDLQPGTDLSVLQPLTVPIVATTQRPPEAPWDTLPLRPFDVTDPAARRDAIAVIEASAKNADLSYELTDRRVAGRVARLLNGYPIALVMAGRQAAALTLEHVLQQLVDGAHAMGGSVEAALHMTWAALTFSERDLLYLTTLSPRALTTTSMAAILGRAEVEVIESVGELVRAGVLQRSAFPRPFELLADFAHRQLPIERRQDAARIEKGALALAQALAEEDAPVHVDAFPTVGDGPSLWTWAVQHDDLHGEDLSTVLAALLRWCSVVNTTPPHTTIELLERADACLAWTQYGRSKIRAEPRLAQEVLRERALPRARTAAERALVWNVLAAAHLNAVQLDDVFDACRRAVEEGGETCYAAYCEGVAHTFRGNDDDALDAFRRAEALRPSHDLKAAASITAMRLYAMRTLSAEALMPAIDHCLRTAEDSGLASSMALALKVAAATLSALPNPPPQTGELARRALNLSMQLGDLYDVKPLYILWGLAIRADDVAAAHELIRQIDARPSMNGGEDVLRCATSLLEGEDDVTRCSPRATPNPDWVEGCELHLLVKLVSSGRPPTDEDLAKFRRRATRVRVRNAIAVRLVDVNDLREVCEIVSSLQHPPDERFELTDIFAKALMRRAPTLLQTMLACDHHTLVVLNNYDAVGLSGQWTDLTRQRLTAHALSALVDANEPLDYEALGAQLYPDEKVAFSALKNRIDVQLSRLRKLGLKGLITKREAGFTLDVEPTFARVSPDKSA